MRKIIAVLIISLITINGIGSRVHAFINPEDDYREISILSDVEEDDTRNPIGGQ